MKTTKRLFAKITLFAVCMVTFFFGITMLTFGKNSNLREVSAATHVHDYNEMHYCFGCSSFDVWVGSTQVTMDNKEDVLGDGTVQYVYYNDHLKLNNATIDTVGAVDVGVGYQSYFGIYFGNFTDFTITVSGNCTISKQAGYDGYSGILSTAHRLTLILNDGANLDMTLYNNTTGISLCNTISGNVLETTSKLEILGLGGSMKIDAGDGIVTGEVVIDDAIMDVTGRDTFGIMAFQSLEIKGEMADVLVGAWSGEVNRPIHSRYVSTGDLLIHGCDWNNGKRVNCINKAYLSALEQFYITPWQYIFGHHYEYEIEGETGRFKANTVWIHNYAHEHSFTLMVESPEFLAEEGTCQTLVSKYYYSCECGEKDTRTFSAPALFPKHVLDEYFYVNNADNFTHQKYYSCCGSEANALEPHEFGDDETCNLCGGTYLNHEHTLTYYMGATHHYQYCVSCDYRMPDEEHEFGVDNICDGCNYDVEAGHVHYMSKNKITADKHVYKCDFCDLETSGYHEFGAGDICEVCGYDREYKHVHKLAYCGNGEGHWIHCGFCDYSTDIESHVFDQDNVCTVCFYHENGEHYHMFNYPFFKDAEGHWCACECGELSQKYDHYFEDGQCFFCAYKQTANNGCQDLTGVIIGASVGGVIGIGVAVAVVIIKRKKQK